jgi:hypothetical protein
MDQLHLPPDLYRDLRDRSNAGVSAWLGGLAKLGRWSKRQLGAGSDENSLAAREAFQERSNQIARKKR